MILALIPLSNNLSVTLNFRVMTLHRLLTPQKLSLVGHRNLNFKKSVPARAALKLIFAQFAQFAQFEHFGLFTLPRGIYKNRTIEKTISDLSALFKNLIEKT